MTKKHHRIIWWFIVGFIALNAILFFIYISLPPKVVVTPPSEVTPRVHEDTATNTASSTITEVIALPPAPEKVLQRYIEVTDGCGPHFAGECLRVRSGPGVNFPVVAKLRNNMVLKVNDMVEKDGHVWYKIIFDEWLRYPERTNGDWYVIGDYVKEIYDEGTKATWGPGSTTVSDNITKKIIVDRTKQQLQAYDGETLFMETPISTGLDLTPTPRGTFHIFKKTPSRYMQGPIPELADQQVYDLPGVPWNLYFTDGGAVIHGAYWHTNFGKQYSHGCVNLLPENARKLYEWAELGTKVVVID